MSLEKDIQQIQEDVGIYENLNWEEIKSQVKKNRVVIARTLIRRYGWGEALKIVKEGWKEDCTDKEHLITEMHYQRRKLKDEDWNMGKVT